MGRRGRIGAGAAALLASVAIAACGGGSGGSGAAADPADMAPASSVIYASATVQPGAEQLKSLEHVVDTVGGSGTWSKFLGKLDHALSQSSEGVTFDKDIKPWLGNRIGIALTRYPADTSESSNFGEDLVIIAPTDDPQAAEKALPKLEHSEGSNNEVTAKVIGSYVLFGGKAAVSAAEAVTAGDSLAESSAYQADLAKIPSDALGTVYAKARPAVSALAASAESAAASQGVAADSSALTGALAKIPADASLMAGVSVTEHAVALDVTASEVPGSSGIGGASVSSLPADSWLALALPGIPKKSIDDFFQEVGQSAASEPAEAEQVQSVEKAIAALVPHGIGQINFSISGASKNVHAGLSLDLKSDESAHQAVTSLYQLLALSGAPVHGSPSGFSLSAEGLHLQVGSSGTDLVVTIGYPQPAQFTSPGSELSEDPVYKSALEELPPKAPSRSS